MKTNNYQKRTEAYDAPVLVIEPENFEEATNLATQYLILNNKKIVENITEIKKDEKGLKYVAVQNLDLYNSLRTMNIFKILNEQNKFEKLNIVCYNPYQTYRKTLKENKEFIEHAKNLKDLFKGKGNPGEGVTAGVPYSVALSIKASKDYADIFEGRNLIVPEAVKSESLSLNVYLQGKSLKDEFTIENMTKKLSITFTRFEIDFVKKKMDIYSSMSDFDKSNKKQFEPWKGDMEEKLEKTLTFKELKMLVMKNTGEYDPDNIFEGIMSEIFQELFDYPIVYEQDYKEIVHKNAERGTDFLVKYELAEILNRVAFGLESGAYNYVVEKTRKLISNKKGKQKFKTFKSEYYDFDYSVMGKYLTEYVQYENERFEQKKSSES